MYKQFEMETAELRDKLHQYIDIADERKLQAIYTVLESDIEPVTIYDADIIELFHARRQNHLDGKSKSYSAEESIDIIRKQFK